MENKYYTPETDEFHIGFECEFRNDTDESPAFKPEVCDCGTLGLAFDIDEHEGKEDFAEHFRVKYLDKEDVEKDGWEVWEMKTDGAINCYKPYFDKRYGENKKVNLLYNLMSKWGLVTNGQSVTIFCGYIKNISELRRLMKQLDIK